MGVWSKRSRAEAGTGGARWAGPDLDQGCSQRLLDSQLLKAKLLGRLQRRHKPKVKTSGAVFEESNDEPLNLQAPQGRAVVYHQEEGIVLKEHREEERKEPKHLTTDAVIRTLL